VSDGDGALGLLERRRSTLYLVASAGMVVFAVHTALRTTTGAAYPPVQQFVAPAGFLIGLLGLLGLYRPLSARAPWLTRVALAVAAVSALDWAAIVVAGVLETAGVIPENGTFGAITGVVALFSMVLAYGLFGVASTRTGVYRQAVGGLLLLEAVTFLAMVANSFASLGAPVIVFELGHLIAYLGLGVILRGEGDPNARAERRTDATV